MPRRDEAIRATRPASRRRRARERSRAMTPRRDRAIDAHDRPVGPSQIEIEREAHRERVDRAAARDPQRAVRRQGVEAAEPAPRARRPRASCTRRPPREVARGQRGEPPLPAAWSLRSADRAQRRRAARSSPLRRHLAQARDELVDRDAALVAVAVAAHRDRALLGLAVARRRACRGSCAARRRGSCARPTRCGRRARRAARRRAAVAATVAAASSWRSAIGSTIAWTGASHSGNSPA